ncbi:MAG: hypothetical protein A2606_01155 [Candidatus Yanofskybacteria bacterium RIFOXYD1_FULL_42_10]|uniref:Radical SAM core domain-containing protein n=2 Tax=Candidatus Yanofskyibacteriota TaxID=1752733 RepID=A0A1F8HVM1_9BACT|nr:MAG: hypothetical protein UU84_C0023G0006 [Candidatus Yanofskybacteria bacterium GW2011_GWC2_41_9]OGN09900.1 MAG: hypothetical protein A3C64_00865 [Candidatus Yanofskybacteria bacterium RIFCSPHIGHO2_02_FULL_41_12]OGN41601.1 MAG: hypothetical protein A2606_01155 [Candidatus Yanofskybacteria bacterium RIFOXYD1_FULL_42_10]
MYQIFKNLVAKGLVKYDSLNCVRVKVHDTCQWSCHFCHKEGSGSSNPVYNGTKFADTLVDFRDQLGFTEVHFTGGEPAIHTEITELIKTAKKLDFRVKMTSNGQTGVDQYLACIDCGLDELNLSIHTLDGAQLAKMMSPIRNTLWGNRAIERQLTLISLLREHIKIKINTVVIDNENPALRIVEFVSAANLEWRVMNELEHTEVSYSTMMHMCNKLGAKPLCAQIIQGSSSCGIIFQTLDGFIFKVKLIRPFLVESLCGDCSLEKVGQCREFYYGPRIEAHNQELMVRSCLHRSNPPSILAAEEFFTHRIAKDIIALKKASSI